MKKLYASPPPRIFNIFVYAIVHHWVGIVLKNKARPDVFGYTMKEQSKLFYAYDSLVASINPVWPQWGFGVLIGIFERVGIRTKVAEMACQPDHILWAADDRRERSSLCEAALEVGV